MPLGILVVATACSLLATGCLHDRFHTDSARSATEQLLITTSVERAVEALDVPDVSGAKVALEVVGLGPGLEFYADLDYVAAAFENRLLGEGARLADPKEAELFMTLRVGAVGTVSRQFTLGIPNVDVGVYRSSRQHGYAKLQLVTEDEEGALVASSKPALEQSRHDYVEIMQIIFRRQDIYPDDGFVGID